MNYIGWVPTVTGHLSFSTIGTGSFPTRCWRREQGSRICVVQRRDLLDVLVPYAEGSEVAKYFREKLANLVVGISGRFWYVMDAVEADDGETVSGVIYMIPGAHNGAAVKQLKSWLANAPNLDGINELIGRVDSASCYSISFSLERGGKAKFSPRGNSSDHRGDDLRRLLVNQAFFFLKDNAHVHQHHHPTHDAITEVTELDETKLENDWVSETQFSLYRAIIRYKRFKNEKALFRAAGILAYAEAFDRNYGTEHSPAKRYHADALRESLAIGREEIKHFQGKALSISESFRGFFFAVFGLVAATGIFARLGGAKNIVVDDSIITIAAYVANKPWTVIGLTALLSFVWAFITHRIDPSEFILVRLSLRLLQGFRLRWTFLFNCVAVAVCMGIAYFFLR